MLPDDARHGTNAGRKAHQAENSPPCEPCRSAAADYERRRQARRYLARGPLVIPNVGTRRRLQALQCIGWTGSELSAAMGREMSYCTYLIRTRSVHRDTAAMVSDLYKRLCMTRKAGWLADRTAALAERKGWLPPLAWDDIDDLDEIPMHADRKIRASITDEKDIDEAVVIRVLRGDAIAVVSRAEREEVVRRWSSTGRPLNDLARLTGWKVERYGCPDAA